MKLVGGPHDGREVPDVPSMLYDFPRHVDHGYYDPDLTRFHIERDGYMRFYDPEGRPEPYIVCDQYRREGDVFVFVKTIEPKDNIGPLPSLT